MPDVPLILEYAKPPPRWRRIARRSLTVIIVVAIAVAAAHYGPTLLRRARIMYWQSKCMNYAAEIRGKVVFIQLGKVQAATTRDSSDLTLQTGIDETGGNFLYHLPECYERFTQAWAHSSQISSLKFQSAPLHLAAGNAHRISEREADTHGRVAADSGQRIR